MVVSKTFPDKIWETLSPQEAGFKPEGLAAAETWLKDNANGEPYRIVIARHGRLVAEWQQGISQGKKVKLASATKSVYSNMLGIIVEEGKLESPDVKLKDVYPIALEVPEGSGPKEGRYVFDKDHDITLRQLISNTSGYMKPSEEPGQVYNYQTFGMNVLIHALSQPYGLYDPNDPERKPGFEQLIETRIGQKIGADWEYAYYNFPLPDSVRLDIFGYFCNVVSTARDMARLGWLWANYGNWNGEQVIPESWMRESVKVAPTILEHCPKEDWQYGYGFWTNSEGVYNPNLPRNYFSARGAGKQYIAVVPSLELVVVLSPGLWLGGVKSDPPLLELICEACQRA